MNAEDFLRKRLKIELEKEFQGGADLSVINQVIEDCIVEYRRRSCFKPNVWDFYSQEQRDYARN